MAFTVTARHSGNQGQTAVETITSNSQTPTANSLLVVGAGHEHDAQAITDSYSIIDSADSLIFNDIAAAGHFDWNGNAVFQTSMKAWYAAVGGSPVACTINVDPWVGGAQDAYQAIVAADITGHDTADPIVQFKIGGAEGNGGSNVGGSIELDATPFFGNLVVVIYMVGDDAGTGISQPTFGLSGEDFTAVFNQTGTIYVPGSLWYRVIDGTETNNIITVADFGGTVGNWTGIAFEVAASGTGSQSITPAATSVSVAPGSLSVTPPTSPGPYSILRPPVIVP